MFNYEKFNNENNQIFLDKLKNEIETWDNNFFKNNYDRNIYKMRKKQNKNMITEYGKITYSRRIYQHKITGEYICFTDLNFGLEKKQQIPINLKNKILDNLHKGNTLLEIKSKFPKADFSTGVKILSKELPYIIENENKKITLKDNSYLYINSDDCYKNLRLNGIRVKHRIRLVTFNTGKIWDIKKKRYRLENKRFTYILIQEGKAITKDFFINFVKQKIKEFYIGNNIKLVVCGDGASWIKNLAVNLEVKYIVDKYHAVKILWNTFVTKNKRYLVNWNGYYEAVRVFDNGNYEELINVLIKYKVKKDIINYFKRSKLGVINQTKDWNIGCSAESDVYHFVKSLCSGARIFSYNHFLNMLRLKAYQYNNL